MNIKLNLAKTLPNLKVIRVKCAIALDRKVAKNYKVCTWGVGWGGRGGGQVCARHPPYKRDFKEL